MRSTLFACVLYVAVGCVYAQSDIYLCTDANGKKEYRNTDIGKSCKKVNLPGIVTVAPPAMKGVISSPDDAALKVANDVQKNRDVDRKQILMDELKSEQARLDKIKKDYAGVTQNDDRAKQLRDDISRSERSIEALNREIVKTK